jgi:hypothetical protein
MLRTTVPRCGDDSYAPVRNAAAVLIASRVIAVALLFGLHVNAADDALRRIEDRSVAPCCWQQGVAVHDSDIATQMCAEIASMVADGKNEEQIVNDLSLPGGIAPALQSDNHPASCAGRGDGLVLGCDGASRWDFDSAWMRLGVGG